MEIAIMVIITITVGQAKEDLEIMNDMMSEMNERLVRTEAELIVTKDALMSSIDELDTMKETKMEMNERLSLAEKKLAKTESELAATKDDLAIAKADHAITKEKTDELVREVTNFRAPPYIHACGSNTNFLSFQSHTIPYTSLLYSSTNTEGGGLDIITGVFTAPWGGSYTVYWDTTAYLLSGEYVYIYLQKNGGSIKESVHFSAYYGPSGFVYEQGGRTIIVYLGEGDTLQLYRDAGSNGISHTTFCVSLTTFDIV